MPLHESPAKLGEDSHGLQCLDISSLACVPPSLLKQSFHCPHSPGYKASFLEPSKTRDFSHSLPTKLLLHRRRGMTQHSTWPSDSKC